MTYLDLQRKLHDQPFKPFRIRLVNNTAYDVTEPWMVLPSKTSAVVVTRIAAYDLGYRIAEDWRTISISHILEFQDLPSRPKPKRKRA